LSYNKSPSSRKRKEKKRKEKKRKEEGEYPRVPLGFCIKIYNY
jgi:hypothetical protein